MKFHSVYDMFLHQVGEFGERTFLRHKVDGEWKDISWNEMNETVLKVAKGILRLGVPPGRAVGILSESRVEWVFADMGIVSIGCITTAAYTSSPPKDVAYIFGHAETPLVIVENREQLDKVLEKLDDLPELKKIVIFDPEGSDKHDMVISYDELIALGSNADPDIEKEFEKRTKEITPETLLTYIYTSGTTGPPKGAMLTHGNAIFIAEVSNSFGFVEPADSSLSFLPLAHALERMVFYMSVLSGGVVNFAESIYKVAENLPEVRPTVLVCVPRVLEKIYERVMAQVEDQSAFKKKVFRWALEVGAGRSDYVQRKMKAPAMLEMKYRIADALVFKKIRERTGGNLRWIGSGGAPLSEEVNKFFNAAGMQVVQAYGLTETSAPAILTPVGEGRIGRVGKHMPGVDVEIAEDGEILIRGGNVFKGYLKNPEATEEALKDGWFHSGDTGEFDEEGYLKITGRKKDLIITAGGKNITPQKLELLFSSIPLVSQVVIVGDNRKYLTAIFTVNSEELEPFASEHGLEPQDGRPIELHPKVIDTIEKEVKEKNKELPKYEQIKQFRIVPHEFTVDSGELTPTLKVKKRIVFDRYKDLIDEMYP